MSYYLLNGLGYITFHLKRNYYVTQVELHNIISTFQVKSNTVEPLNNRHFGTTNFWHNFTVIERLSSFRGKIVLPWSYRDHKICPL